MKKKLFKNVDPNLLKYKKNLSVFFGDSIVDSSNTLSILRHQKTLNLHIVNPERSVLTLYKALIFLMRLCKKQKRPLKVLFLNTNPEFSNFVRDIAISTQQHYVNSKWVGGTLTNWKQVSKSILAYQMLRIKWKTVLTNTDFRWPKLEKLKKCFGGYFHKMMVQKSLDLSKKNVKEVFHKMPSDLFFSMEDKYFLGVDNLNLGKKSKTDPKTRENGLIKRSNLINILFTKEIKKGNIKLERIGLFFEKKNENKIKFHRLNGPDLLVVLDVNQSRTAITEANLQNIPVIGLARSSTNITHIDFPIIGNNQNPDFLYFCLNWIAVVIRKLSK
uniref:ribosomal protein S2 n=1 Tax=Tetraselmis marina TaxID=41888 RepID=UPI00218240DB|nr:ribosomal protein S2 [Tetraselmis marina]UVF37895.1 ribosomal protein S2 [Tetraselmis marina]